MIAGENDRPIRLNHGFVTGVGMRGRLGKAGPPLLPRPIGSYPRSLVVGNLAPGYVHRLFQFLAVPGMQALDRFAALRKFLCQSEASDVGASFFGVSADQHTPLR